MRVPCRLHQKYQKQRRNFRIFQRLTISCAKQRNFAGDTPNAGLKTRRAEFAPPILKPRMS